MGDLLYLDGSEERDMNATPIKREFTRHELSSALAYIQMFMCTIQQPCPNEDTGYWRTNVALIRLLQDLQEVVRT